MLLVGLALGMAPRVSSAQSRPLRFEQLSMADGLSHNLAYSVTQDARGFLWIGTFDGLSRYDGYGFKIYRHDPHDPTSLSDNKSRVVYVDRSGVLWVGTETGGLNRFDATTETFTHYRHDPSDPRSLGSDDVRAIREDRRGGLWIGSQDGGLSRLDPATGMFTHYRHDPANPDSLGSDDVRALFEDRAGALWICSNRNGLDRFDPATGKFSHYRPDPQTANSISHDDVRAVLEDREGVLWVGTTRAGLDRLDLTTGVITNYRHDPGDGRTLSNNDVRALFEDRLGNLWIATHGGGLNRWDPSTGTFEHHRSDPNAPRSLANDDVRAVYEDRSGVLWIATYGGGLSRFDRELSSFAFYAHDPGDPQSLSDNMVHVIYEDRLGAIWLGTENGGLSRLDRVTGTFKRYRHAPPDPRSLSSDDVRVIYEDRSGVLWIGTNDGGLNRFDRATETFTRYQHGGPETIAADDVRALYEDRQGRFWIGFNGDDVDLMDRSRGTFRPVELPPGREEDDRGGVTGFFEDPSGNPWVAFDEGGLLRLGGPGQEPVAFRHRPGDPSSLSSDAVRAIHLDREGALWVGSLAGLSHFDWATETFTNFREEDGLPSNAVQAILEDQGGSLWLTTDAGICRFDPSRSSFRSYPIAYGRRQKALHAGAASRTADGEMYVAGRNGMVAFFPAQMETPFEPADPSLLFTSFKLAGEEARLENSITEIEEIELSFRDRLFSFEVAMVDLKAPQNYRYAYRLEGLPGDWLDLGERREITFTNLNPRRYTLRVRGRSVDRSVPEQEIALAIRVAPPWWATWWARALAVIAVIGMLALGYQLRTRSIRRTNALLQAEVEERQLIQAEREVLIRQLEAQNAELERFTYTVSHDLKSPLVTIQGFLGTIKQDAEAGVTDRLEDDMARIASAVKTMRRLLDDLLELSRVGRVVRQPEEVALSELAAESAELLSRQIAERGVELWIDPEMPKVRVDRVRMLEVFQNLLDNAIKFMGDQPAPSVEIGATRNGDEVSCHVRDNGTGIEEEYQDWIFGLFDRLDQTVDGTGIGLALVKRIVEVHGGRIWVESEGPGQGSTFRFTLCSEGPATADPSELAFREHKRPEH